MARTGATATPPTVTEARLILPPSICNSAAADTMAKSPWRRENSMNAALWPAGQSGMRIVVTISFNSIAGRQIAGGEILKRDLARAVRARDRHRRVMRGADRHQLGGRIEMAQRAADGAAIAGLPVADVHDGLVQQRAFRLHQVGEFEVALARHGADLERAARLRDVGHALDAG